MKNHFVKTSLFSSFLGIGLWLPSHSAYACAPGDLASCSNKQLCEMSESASSPRHQFMYESAISNRGLNCQGIMAEKHYLSNKDVAENSLIKDKKLPPEELYEKAVDFYEKGDITTSLVYLNEAANQGHRISIRTLGGMYFTGDVVPQDHAKAAEYIRVLAVKGDAESMKTYGYLLMNGLGVSQNLQEAMEWLRKSGEAGDDEAWGYWWQLYEPISESIIHVGQDGELKGRFYTKQMFYEGNELVSVDRTPLFKRGSYRRDFYSCDILDESFLENTYRIFADISNVYDFETPNKEHCFVASGPKRSGRRDVFPWGVHVYFLREKSDVKTCLEPVQGKECTYLYEMRIYPNANLQGLFATEYLIEDKGKDIMPLAGACYRNDFKLLHDSLGHEMKELRKFMEVDADILYDKITEGYNPIQLAALDYRKVIEEDRISLYRPYMSGSACTDFLKLINDR